MVVNAMLSNESLKNTINFLLFQGLWFACVLGAAKEKMLSAWILFATLLYFHSCKSLRNQRDLSYVLFLLPSGLIIDTTWALTGLIDYKVALPFSFLAPYWIGILWIAFALSLNHSMKWILSYPKLGITFGMIGGPLSYLAAERLGAISINDPIITLSLSALSWLLIMLLIDSLNNKLNATTKESLQDA